MMFLMKNKIIKTIPLCLISSLIIWLCIYSVIKTPIYLSNLTYDIVQESYDNYGDYDKSKYQDIVSENIYKNMNYLYETDYDDRNEFVIYISQHSSPKTYIQSSGFAQTKYIYKTKYDIKGTDSNNIYAKSLCTVNWELGDDNLVKEQKEFHGNY